jgi:hypothetical protein
MDFTLNAGQFELVYNVFSLTLATMFGSGIFFFAARNQVAPKYRPALIVSGVAVFIAGYRYFRIFESWAKALVLEGGSYVPSGIAFILPMIGLSGATAEVGLQVGYSIADLTAKALYGVFIYRIAMAKSEADGWNLGAAPNAA